MDKIGQAYEMLLTGAALILAVLMIISIIRSVLGPKISDRIIAVNMTGTMVIMVIARQLGGALQMLVGPRFIAALLGRFRRRAGNHPGARCAARSHSAHRAAAGSGAQS